MLNFCRQILSSAFSSNYNAKMFVLFLGYVIVLFAMLPNAVDSILSEQCGRIIAQGTDSANISQQCQSSHNSTEQVITMQGEVDFFKAPRTLEEEKQTESEKVDSSTTLESQVGNTKTITESTFESYSQYLFLIFLPFIGLTALYIENFIGILALFFALILSDRLKIFQHYVLLFLLYLLCAYLSLEYGSLMPGFYSNILGVLDMIAHHNYALLFASYSRGVVWVFLALAVFDLAFYRAKNPPRLVRENLIFALLLYVVVFGIYSYDSKSLVLY